MRGMGQSGAASVNDGGGKAGRGHGSHGVARATDGRRMQAWVSMGRGWGDFLRRPRGFEPGLSPRKVMF
jgi:hypothetical protein